MWGDPAHGGGEGGERFYLERSVLPWKTQDPKGRQPFLGQAGHRQARLLAEEARGAVALFMIKAWYSNSKTAQILWFLVFVLFCFNFKGKNSRTSLAHLFRVYEADIFFRCFKCWFPKVMGKNVLRYVLDTVSKYFTRINQCDPQSDSVREGRLSSAFYMWGN